MCSTVFLLVPLLLQECHHSFCFSISPDLCAALVDCCFVFLLLGAVVTLAQGQLWPIIYFSSDGDQAHNCCGSPCHAAPHQLICMKVIFLVTCTSWWPYLFTVFCSAQYSLIVVSVSAFILDMTVTPHTLTLTVLFVS